MDALIKMVAEKTGISEAQATTAVNTVFGFIKDKLPPGISTQVEAFIKGDKSAGDNTIDNLKDMMGGMFK